jgi:hypothetical protein
MNIIESYNDQIVKVKFIYMSISLQRMSNIYQYAVFDFADQWNASVSICIVYCLLQNIQFLV